MQIHPVDGILDAMDTTSRCWALFIIGCIIGIMVGATVHGQHRPSWNAGFEYGIRMYHSADPDLDVNYLRWQKEKR